MKNLLEQYFNLKAKVEDFFFENILPIIFKTILFGLRITLIWAFYLIFTKVIFK